MLSYGQVIYLEKFLLFEIKKDNYQYNSVNWFKFIFNATKICKIDKYSEVY